MALRISVNCYCGQVGRVGLGQTWVCPQCARRWDTNQIPAEEYQSFVADLRRIRVTVLAGLVVSVALDLVLVAMIGLGMFLILPLALGGWYMWYQPRYRRQLRALYSRIPRWRLSADDEQALGKRRR